MVAARDWKRTVIQRERFGGAKAFDKNLSDPAEQHHRLVGQVMLLLAARLLPVRRMTLLEDPSVRQIGDLDHHRQVIATEAVAGLPLLAITVNPLDGDVVADAALGLVRPNGGLDASQPHFMDWFIAVRHSYVLLSSKSYKQTTKQTNRHAANANKALAF
jgi:hypothetical protein